MRTLDKKQNPAQKLDGAHKRTQNYKELVREGGAVGRAVGTASAPHFPLGRHVPLEEARLPRIAGGGNPWRGKVPAASADQPIAMDFSSFIRRTTIILSR